MKKLLLTIFGFLLLPSLAFATVSDSQIAAIINLIHVFGVNAITVATTPTGFNIYINTATTTDQIVETQSENQEVSMPIVQGVNQISSNPIATTLLVERGMGNDSANYQIGQGFGIQLWPEILDQYGTIMQGQKITLTAEGISTDTTTNFFWYVPTEATSSGQEIPINFSGDGLSATTSIYIY